MSDRHPIQPLKLDSSGVLRFKENEIVSYLLKHGGIDLNKLAALDFSDEDRQQFAQLIGYSIGGYAELSYVDDAAYAVARARMPGKKTTDDEARIKYLEEELAEVRKGLREPVARLFGVHPSALGEDTP